MIPSLPLMIQAKSHANLMMLLSDILFCGTAIMRVGM